MTIPLYPYPYSCEGTFGNNQTLTLIAVDRLGAVIDFKTLRCCCCCYYCSAAIVVVAAAAVTTVATAADTRRRESEQQGEGRGCRRKYVIQEEEKNAEKA